MIVLRQKEYVSAEEKEAKMQLAHGILEARENGDTRKEKRLKREFARKDKKLATGIGVAAGTVSGASYGPVGAGIGAGVGALVGRSIGKRISKDRLKRYVNAAKKERYGYSDDNE